MNSRYLFIIVVVAIVIIIVLYFRVKGTDPRHNCTKFNNHKCKDYKDFYCRPGQCKLENQYKRYE